MNVRRRVVRGAHASLLGVVAAVAPTETAIGQNAPGDGSAADFTETIVVTGTRIPSIERQTGLPVQVITREDIERANVQTAAELLDTVSANLVVNSYREVLSVFPGAQFPGITAPSLRGLGSDRTLVLLNGRRLPLYAFATDAVDLNFIPLAAIERVEVLKDGASAIYGSDAIAGVINFVLRKNYRGAEASAQYSSPQHTGGYATRVNALVGTGDLASQSFNIFGMVDYQKYGGIRARDRPFSSTNYIPSEGINGTSGSSFPGNVDNAGNRNPTGDPNNSYFNPSCLPPLSFPTTATPRQCRFDGAAVADILDPSERLSTFGALTWQLDRENQFFLQGLYTRNNFTFAVQPSPLQFTLPVTSAFYPHAFARFFGIDGQDLTVNWRTLELGRRTDATTSEQWNVVAGMQGQLKGWSYDGAVAYGESNADQRYVDGYLKASTLLPILKSGVVNPFGFNTPEVVALMSTAKLNQSLRTAKGTLTSVDFHASNEIYPLPAGPLAVALGAEARRWTVDEVSSDALASADVIGGVTFAVPSESSNRTSWAVFAETNIPIVRTFEANLAVRFDHYSDFGSTTNPKLSLRWQPTGAFVLRASVGTGFHAPGLDAIHFPALYGPTVTALDDPLRCPKSPRDCNTTFPTQFGGNPLLQPETSRQWGVGAVWSPATGVSLGVDYFNVLVKDAIDGFSPVTIFEQCPDGIHGPTCQFIHRGPVDPNYPDLPGPIVQIDQFATNLSALHISGLDFTGQIVFPKLDWGRFKLDFHGTYEFWAKRRQGNGDWVNYINRELSPGVAPYWRHYLALHWDYGPWTATLTDSFQKGTYDERPPANSGTTQRRIGDYDIWNIGGFYAGFTNWTLSAGIKNLFDRNPPLSIQSGTNGRGWDPSYTDPHGRVFWANVKYAFK